MLSLIREMKPKDVYQDISWTFIVCLHQSSTGIVSIYFESRAFMVLNITKANTKTIIANFVHIKDVK